MKQTNIDPFAAREAKKYECPIASREYILQVLKAEQQPLSRTAIARLVGNHAGEQGVALERRLEAMVRDGQLVLQGRRYLPVSAVTVTVPQIIEQVINKFELTESFPKPVMSEVAKLPDEPDCSHLGDREDLRSMPFVTIDGEDAKDFDDAVYCQPNAKGFKLYVAIADVSHYVRADSALDCTAAERGNSVYLPGKVLPMLPEKLSNGLCSLKPQVNRFCLVCEMEITKVGVLATYRFYSAVICSKARLTYSKVAQWLSGDDQQADHQVLPHLKSLYQVFQALLKQREKRGALDVETIETRVVFNTDGEVTGVVPVHRNDAHRLIEECMLVANVAAAECLLKAKMPAPYRIHEHPNVDKAHTLRAFLSLRGILLDGGENPPTRSFNQALRYAKVRPDFSVIQTMVLRTMQQAVYSPHNEGHFGLAYEAYTHFTSPIRRYADLLVHRQLKTLLAKKKSHYQSELLEKLCAHVSDTERKADEASRAATQALKCVYLSQHLGSCFPVVISGVTAFGVFATIAEWMIDGLIHVRTLHDDYYHFDDQANILVGERSGRTFRLGEVLQIRVAKVDVEQGRIDFELLTEDGSPQRARRFSRAGKKPAATAAKTEKSDKRPRVSDGVRKKRRR